MSTCVSHAVRLSCRTPTGRCVTLAARLGYDSADPWAVSVCFVGSGDEIVWLLGRDLLLAGRYARVGEGDVLVGPAGDGVEIHFRSPAGSLRAVVGARALDTFLAATTALVAPGAETLDRDRLVAALELPRQLPLPDRDQSSPC